MSPPAALYDAAVSATGNGVSLKKDIHVKASANGLAKTLAEMEDKWESFTFAPIRESQVSRAMSMHLHLTTTLTQHTYTHTQPAATLPILTTMPSQTLSSLVPVLVG